MFWLLSYPRSGNTFVRYFIEYITKRPTVDWPAIAESIPNMGVDLKADPIAFKSHRWNGKNVDVNGPEALIAIVRDYKECIPRHYKEMPKKTESLIQNFQRATSGIGNKSGADYISVLQAYEKRQGKKIIIYYEDLINKPKETFTKLADFMGYNNEHLNDFLTNFEYHRKNALKSYKPKSHTKGASVKHHQNSIDKNTLQRMKDYLRQQYPKLFHSYLKHY